MPAGSRYCPECGGSQRQPVDLARVGRRYWGFRFQVDPISPPPRRDARWSLIVVGIALIVLGLMLLTVGAIISFAIGAAGSGCGPPPCSLVDPGIWFEWAGGGLAVVGLPFVALGIWRGVH